MSDLAVKILFMVLSTAWRSIRTLRSAPPGLAGSDNARRGVFAASLEQSEELFTAAATVGPASKPLLLFYGLSQAGRAIAAAHNESGTWRILGHGLKVRNGGPSLGSAVVIPVPRKDQADAYSSVAAATHSPTLAGATTLGALWAATPELHDAQHIAAGETRALRIALPAAHSSMLGSMLEPAQGSVVVAGEATEVALASILNRYARTEGYQLVGDVTPVTPGTCSALLHWPAEPSVMATPGTKAFRSIHSIADYVDGSWFLQPRLGDPPSAPSRLLVWWALLIALSSLARYHPSSWTAALDVDRSPMTVELEDGLRIAERRVPELIAHALRGPDET